MTSPSHDPRPVLSTPALLITELVLVGVFAWLAVTVGAQRSLPFDAPALSWLHDAESGGVTRFAEALGFLGSKTFLAPVSLLLAALLFWRARRVGVFFALSIGGMLAINMVAKEVFARPRPDLYPPLALETSFSFPSGHAMGTVALALALYLAAAHVAPKARAAVGWVGLLVVIGMGLSRPYLQVHYPSDVLAGWALSAAWVLAVYAWYSSGQRGPGKARRQPGSPNTSPHVPG